jgi:NitT/TauT family transport system permease protein
MNIRQPISNQLRITIQLISVALIVCFYSYLSQRQHAINPTDKTIPTFTQLYDAWKILLSPDSSKKIWLLEDFYYSGMRFVSGLSLGVFAGFLIGILMGVYPIVEAFFRWPIKILGSVPPTAMLALYFVLFGIEFKMYIAMISFSIFPGIALSIYRAALTDVSEHAISKAYTLGASSVEVIIDVVLRQILPRIIEFIRLAIGPALIFLIAAEWANADVGFGYRLKIQSRLSNMNVVYSYLCILSLVSFLIDYSLFQLRVKYCKWFGDY